MKLISFRKTFSLARGREEKTFSREKQDKTKVSKVEIMEIK
jgi:hypothetical protein